MFGIDSINISFAFGTVFFFAALILLIIYAIYSYRHTVPEVSTSKRVVLIFLRASALLILLLLLFEPVLSITNKEYNRPVNLIFIDNSRSISVRDVTSPREDVNSFLIAVNRRNIRENSVFFTFGNKVVETKYDSLNPEFKEGVTNFAEIFTTAEKSGQNIASIVVISDGVITEGSNPLYKASELNIPVFTLGVGDTSQQNDLKVTDVLYNEYIYSGVSTTISASLLNTGFSGRNVRVTLNENGKAISVQNITLNEEGILELKFEYQPATPGEKKLSIAVSEPGGEQNIENNRKVFYINVLSNKIKILVIAGSPSSDLSFIKNTLEQDKNLSVSTITQIGAGKYLEDINRERSVDTSDIIYLVGFPSKQTDDAFLKKVFNEISVGKKPFFIILTDGIDFGKLSRFQSELPFTFSRISEGYTEVLPDINLVQMRNPLIYSGTKTSSGWSSLPPVFMINSDVTVKPETDVLATVKIRNIPVKKPLILVRKLGSKKSAAVLGKEIWRWKLQTATKDLKVYDNFLLNSVKWLNTGEGQKQFVVRTSKKLYSRGEKIPFTAQVYDAAFNPITDSKVDVKIRSDEETNNLSLDPVENGLYEGIFETNKTGDYSYIGTAILDNDEIGSDRGTFNVGEVDIEMLNTRMNFQLLSLLASETNGRFFMPAQQEELLDILEGRIAGASDVNVVTSEITLWSNVWLLFIVILLFAVEWFIRKQSGML